MVHSLLVTNPVIPVPERKRQLYSLFEKVDGRWIRRAETSYYLNTARLVFSDRLLNGCLAGKKMDIRPIHFD